MTQILHFLTSTARAQKLFRRHLNCSLQHSSQQPKTVNNSSVPRAKEMLVYTSMGYNLTMRDWGSLNQSRGSGLKVQGSLQDARQKMHTQAQQIAIPDVSQTSTTACTFPPQILLPTWPASSLSKMRAALALGLCLQSGTLSEKSLFTAAQSDLWLERPDWLGMALFVMPTLPGPPSHCATADRFVF